jgi:hypothetical protein
MKSADELWRVHTASYVALRSALCERAITTDDEDDVQSFKCNIRKAAVQESTRSTASV